MADSQNPPSLLVAEEEGGGKGLSKKAAKKEALKAEKAMRRQQEEAAAAAAASLSLEADPLAGNYGDTPLADLQSKEVSGRRWTEIQSLVEELKDEEVLIRGRAQTIRAVGKNMAFVVLRRMGFTVQCVVTAAPELVSRQMVKFAAGLSRESIVDVQGIVTVPGVPIKGASQQVEVQVRKIYCISRAAPNLPINIEDAARSEKEIEEAKLAGETLVSVGQDTRLNYRVLDIRTPANQGIFRIQSQVGTMFRQFLLAENFIEIHTPKLIAGSSEGGSAVFKLEYKGQPACLAQSPQLHKQISICGDFGRVFEIGPVFRAEDSYTHRHLCEFTGLDVEMEIKEHYFEVMDIVDRLFVSMFDSLNEQCKKELDAIAKQYPFKPLKYLRKTLKLTFQEGVQMLKEAGIEVDPLGDLNTESERKLGQLVLEKYDTEFYMLHRYPLAVRPFYTMPCYDDPTYSNSFDVFIRGEEIISGAQRVHVPEFLTARAEACGIDVKTISTYVDSFSGNPKEAWISPGSVILCMTGNMATAESDKLLADMWASFIAGGAPMKCSSHNEEHSKKSTSPQTWEDLPHLKRDGSAELLQRLLSLGRWISMGEEDWEQLLDGNIVGNHCEPSASNCTSGGAELTSGPKDVRREKTPMWKRLACIEEIFRNELDVVELKDLGNDYLESLLASL